VGALEKAMSRRTAAVLLEPLESTVHVPSTGYFAEVRSLCDRHGALLIVDEALTGLGTTGRLFAMDRYGIVPDVLVLGKSLSGGLYPMAASLFRIELQRFLDTHPHVQLSAFAGSDLGCAVALRTIELVEELELADRAQDLGDLLKFGLRGIAAAHPLLMVDVRGRGLLLAVEMRDGALGAGLACALRKRGVLAGYLPHDRSVLRLLPPLVISEADVLNVAAAFEGALEEIADPVRAFTLHVTTPDPEHRLVA
jgi:acetylornithine/succinyldiaminopimelate/putrescine aminotransferase